MKYITIASLLMSSCLLLPAIGNADNADTQASTKKEDTSVFQKVGKAIDHGAKAAVHGVERGLEAAGRGIERGAKAAEKGVKIGVHAAAKGVKRGAEATANVAEKVAGSSKEPESSHTGTPSKN